MLVGLECRHRNLSESFRGGEMLQLIPEKRAEVDRFNPLREIERSELVEIQHASPNACDRAWEGDALQSVLVE